jgi:prevent-host-death family protein
MSHMERIGVRELRQNASRYLKRVAEGESFEISDRGRAVAVLVPVRPSGRDRMIAEGRLRPGEGSVLDLGPPLPLPPGVEAPSVVLERLRAE